MHVFISQFLPVSVLVVRSEHKNHESCIFKFKKCLFPTLEPIRSKRKSLPVLWQWWTTNNCRSRHLVQWGGLQCVTEWFMEIQQEIVRKQNSTEESVPSFRIRYWKNTLSDKNGDLRYKRVLIVRTLLLKINRIYQSQVASLSLY
jgi:hypothetical protein